MRKSIIHSDDQDRSLKIGIDLGGTKVEIILLDSNITDTPMGGLVGLLSFNF